MLQYFQNNRGYPFLEIYQKLLFEMIYNLFFFLPKKVNLCSMHKYEAKNNALNSQYAWPSHVFPFLHVHAIQRSNYCGQPPGAHLQFRYTGHDLLLTGSPND